MIVSGLDPSGVRISIDDVASGRTRLECDCGSGLIAKKGEVNAAHFAHEAGGQGSCGVALREGLVELAVAAIHDAGEIVVPWREQSKAISVEAVRKLNPAEFAGVQIEAHHRHFILLLRVDGGTYSVAELGGWGVPEATPLLEVGLARWKHEDDRRIGQAIVKNATKHRRWLRNAKLGI